MNASYKEKYNYWNLKMHPLVTFRRDIQKFMILERFFEFLLKNSHSFIGGFKQYLFVFIKYPSLFVVKTLSIILHQHELEKHRKIYRSFHFLLYFF